MVTPIMLTNAIPSAITLPGLGWLFPLLAFLALVVPALLILRARRGDEPTPLPRSALRALPLESQWRPSGGRLAA